MKRALIAVAGIVFCATGAKAQRLPGSVETQAYELTFAPNLEKATFGGEELIRVRLLKPAKTITLNSAEIEFQEASVKASGATQKAEVTLDAAKEMATLAVAK